MVGNGLLTAAICGNIYTSLNVTQIQQAINLVGSGSGGTLLVIKNYTGDVLNFGLASKQTKASGLNIDGHVIIVSDNTDGALHLNRGLVGTVLVYKVSAALACSGMSLAVVEEAAKQVANAVATIDVRFLAADKVKLGMGLHNEPGFQHLHPTPPLNELID
ncbi:Dihydroxyacetone kinase 2 [Tulasnella sp. 331]|nr:Dihydroxyacetone kinase 2 [Tulasnella sp. 331]